MHSNFVSALFAPGVVLRAQRLGKLLDMFPGSEIHSHTLSLRKCSRLCQQCSGCVPLCVAIAIDRFLTCFVTLKIPSKSPQAPLNLCQHSFGIWYAYPQMSQGAVSPFVARKIHSKLRRGIPGIHIQVRLSLISDVVVHAQFPRVYGRFSFDAKFIPLLDSEVEIQGYFLRTPGSAT